MDVTDRGSAAPANVSAQVLNYVKAGIEDGTWGSGDRIPTEQQLCRILGVSRISVRAAIHQLSSLGVLRSVRGSGTYVCEGNFAKPFAVIFPTLALNRNDLISMMEFRKILEVETAGLAAQRIDMGEVNNLFRLAEAMECASVQGEIARCDMEFHLQISRATRNFVIIKVYEILSETYLRMFEYHVSLFGTRSAAAHKRIAAAIGARNVELARRYMAEHLELAAARYFQTWAEGLGPEA